MKIWLTTPHVVRLVNSTSATDARNEKADLDRSRAHPGGIACLIVYGMVVYLAGTRRFSSSNQFWTTTRLVAVAVCSDPADLIIRNRLPSSATS